ncbi:MAG: radical SAM protein, partial [Candidatus Omnitrophota bacterium]|nr:radical SAM protein [Candidatus Omnitrophota bacterium]
MKIALVRVPSSLGIIRKITHNIHPVNIAYIASFLMEKGHIVEIWDFEVEEYSKLLLNEKLKRFNPGIVGISCMTPGIKTGNLIAEEVKKFSKDIQTIVGGIHSTVLPERTLEEFPGFDMAVFGEGELTLLEVCESLIHGKGFKGIEGLAYRENGRIIKNGPRGFIDDLDRLPHPARSLLKFDLYQQPISPGLSQEASHYSTGVFTSRGCPFSCTFCAAHNSTGKKVRERSFKNIESEISQLFEYKINHIYFFDSTFMIKVERVKEIGKILKKYNMTWNCEGRVDLVTPSLLEDMKRNGCIKISFGVESGSERILKLINKKITREQIINAFQWSHDAGIVTSALFILGSHPSETLEEVELSYKLAKEVKTKYPVYSIITPYPGTEVYSIMKEKNLIETEDWDNFATHNRRPSWRTENFSSQDLVNMQKKLIRRHYLNISYIINSLLGIRNLKDLRYMVKAGLG